MGTLRGIFLDQDGVIIDRARWTPHVVQRDLQGVQLPRRLGIDEYKRLLQIAGGNERMEQYLQTNRFGRPVEPEEVDDLIAPMQGPKTASFIDRVESGRLSLRPGIHRFQGAAAGLRPRLAVDSTSREKAAHAIAYQILKDIPFEVVLAANVVSEKKPNPKIYQLALAKMGPGPDDILVVEGSRNGTLAGKAAGMRVVASSNVYTEQEDLSPADAIVTCPSDPGGEKAVLRSGPAGVVRDGLVHVEALLRRFEA